MELENLHKESIVGGVKRKGCTVVNELDGMFVAEGEEIMNPGCSEVCFCA